MSTLHLVFTSPTAGTALADCVRVAANGDALLLLQDGVHAAVAHAVAPAAMLREAAANGVSLQALAADVAARGLSGRLHPGVSTVDDDGFVALTESHERCVSWF